MNFCVVIICIIFPCPFWPLRWNWNQIYLQYDPRDPCSDSWKSYLLYVGRRLEISFVRDSFAGDFIVNLRVCLLVHVIWIDLYLQRVLPGMSAKFWLVCVQAFTRPIRKNETLAFEALRYFLWGGVFLGNQQEVPWKLMAFQYPTTLN